MASSLPQPAPRVLFSSVGRGWTALHAGLVHVPPGLARATAGEQHRLGIHFGPPVNAECTVGGLRRRGVQGPGDIGVVPAGTDGSWVDDADCRILRLTFCPSLLEHAAEELGQDAGKIELRTRLRLRDARIEAIGWAIKADLEADTPSDPLYIDHLVNALGVRLIELGDPQRPNAENSSESGLPARQCGR